MPCHVDGGGVCCVFNASTVRRALMTTGRCPSCQKAYLSEILGPQPSGTMTVVRDETTNCSSYPGVPTLTVTFNFDSGIQTERMPRPGAQYSHATPLAGLSLTRSRGSPDE